MLEDKKLLGLLISDNLLHAENKYLFGSMHKVWVKLMVFANTGENHRVLNSLSKVKQII